MPWHSIRFLLLITWCLLVFSCVQSNIPSTIEDTNILPAAVNQYPTRTTEERNLSNTWMPAKMVQDQAIVFAIEKNDLFEIDEDITMVADGSINLSDTKSLKASDKELFRFLTRFNSYASPLYLATMRDLSSASNCTDCVKITYFEPTFEQYKLIVRTEKKPTTSGPFANSLKKFLEGKQNDSHTAKMQVSESYALNSLTLFLTLLEAPSPYLLIDMTYSSQDQDWPKSVQLYSDGSAEIEGQQVDSLPNNINTLFDVVNMHMYSDRSYLDLENDLNIADGKCDNCLMVTFWDLGANAYSTIHIFTEQETNVAENEVLNYLHKAIYDAQKSDS